MHFIKIQTNVNNLINVFFKFLIKFSPWGTVEFQNTPFFESHANNIMF